MASGWCGAAALVALVASVDGVAPPALTGAAIPISGKGWTFVGGDWLHASPSPYPYSLPPNATDSWNAPAEKIDAAHTNEFGSHPVVDDVHLAIYESASGFGDFNASFDFTSTAQLASGFFILRARDAAHYYMIEFP